MTENRIDPVLTNSVVDQVLPDHIKESYPNFVAFIKAYYDFLDQEDNFGFIITDLKNIRDIGSTDMAYLDNMLAEVGIGISKDFFIEPREVIKNFANFFRVKGTNYSIEGFFRAFFGVDVEVEYPKELIFQVGDSASTIGPESGHIIQDGKTYQILSLLISSPLGYSQWSDLYKKYVHPAGFYISAEAELVSNGRLDISPIESIPEIDSDLDLELPDINTDAKASTPKRLKVSNIGNADILFVKDSSFNVEPLEIIPGIFIETGTSYDRFQRMEWGDQSFDSYQMYGVYTDESKKIELFANDRINTFVDSFGLISIYNIAKFDSDPRYDINNVNQNFNRVITFRDQKLSDYSNDTVMTLKDIIV